MLGVDLDYLARRDAQRRAQRLAGVALGSVTLSIVMAALTLVAIGFADDARRQRDHAEGLVEFMLSDLNKRLRPVGRLDILGAVGRRAMAYYDSQGQTRLAPDDLGRRARVLHLLGDISDQRGDLTQASLDFADAASSTDVLLSRQPTDPQRIYEHAQSVYWLGYIAHRRGDDVRAESGFRRYRDLAEFLAARDGDNDLSEGEIVDANIAMGGVELEQGKAREAVEAFSKALVAGEKLIAHAPNDHDRREALIENYAWLADAEAAEGRDSDALRHRRVERTMCERFLRDQPSDTTLLNQLVVSNMAIANLLADGAAPSVAMKDVENALNRLDDLRRFEPDDTDYQEEAVTAFALSSRVNLDLGKIQAASRDAARAQGLAEHLVRHDNAVLLWRGVLLGKARLARIQAAVAGARTRTELANALSPSAAEANRLSELVRDNPKNIRLAQVTSEAVLLRGDYEFLREDIRRARASWLAANQIIQSAHVHGGALSIQQRHLLNEMALRLRGVAPYWRALRTLHP